MATFRTFWNEGKLSPYEELCLRSFVAHGHRVILYSYSTMDLPSGIELVDAESIFSRKDVFYYKSGPGAGSVSAFSNLFRYRLLEEFGDWWTDTDVICLTDSMPSQELFFAYEDADSINGAVLKIPQGHEFARTLRKEAAALGTDFQWGQCGPRLITAVARRLGLDGHAAPLEKAYPLHWTEALDVLFPEACERIEQKTRNSYFLHLWNEMLRRAVILKDIRPPRGSFLASKFEEHGIKFGSDVCYSGEQIRKIRLQMEAAAANQNEITRLNLQLSEQADEIARLNLHLSEQADEIARLNQCVSDTVAVRDRAINEIRRIRSDFTWRWTSPLRKIARRARGR